MEFHDRVAVVTGGASGIGLGMVRSFVRRGMKGVIADLDDGALTHAEKEVLDAGGEAITQRCDVSKLSDIEALADTAINRFGRVNVLCNNAGVGIPTPVTNMKLEDWKWIMDVDLWGPIYGVNVFLP